MIPKKKKRPKQTPLPSLIAKADKLASQYIRRKHADHAGMVKCVSCATVLHWKEAHCAHFVERGKKATRWIEENLWPADAACNLYRKEHHMRIYTLHMIDCYGREKVDELNALAKQVLAPSQVRQLAEDAIAYYSAALKELTD